MIKKLYYIAPISVILTAILIFGIYNYNAVRVEASPAFISIEVGINNYVPDKTLPPTLDIRFEPSGAHVDEDGNLKIRLDFYPREGDKSYDQCHVYVPIIPASGYPGKVDKEGNPVSQKDYDAWEASLPHEWVTNPVLCNFVTVPAGVSADDLLTYIQDTYYADVTSTIDDIMIQPNNSHLISPYMRDKETLAKETVAKSAEGIVVSQVNQRLSGLAIRAGKEKGTVEIVRPQSIDIGDAGVLPDALIARTTVEKRNPANAGGTIDTWQLYYTAAGTGVEVATFYGSNPLSTRDYETIGNVASGSLQTFSGLSTVVATGDYAGQAWASGNPGRSSGGGTGLWYSTSDDRIPCTNAAFSSIAAWRMTCYGTGTEPTAALTGTATAGITEANVVAGGKTIIITLTGDTWVATVGADNAITTALIAGIDSAQSEAHGWDAEVKAKLVYTNVVRTSSTVVTVTLPAEAAYDITATETVTVTIPATAVTLAAQIVATPTFTVTTGFTANIANAPTDTLPFGMIVPNHTYYAKGSAPSNPVTDNQCTYTLTNNGDTAKINVSGTNSTEGIDWTLVTTTPGVNEFRVVVYQTGTNPANGDNLTTSDQQFIASLTGAGAYTYWDFTFITGDDYDNTGYFQDGVAKSCQITITAAVP